MKSVSVSANSSCDDSVSAFTRNYCLEEDDDVVSIFSVFATLISFDLSFRSQTLVSSFDPRDECIDNMQKRIQLLIQSTSRFECIVCLNTIQEMPLVGTCGHVTCSECILKAILETRRNVALHMMNLKIVRTWSLVYFWDTGARPFLILQVSKEQEYHDKVAKLLLTHQRDLADELVELINKMHQHSVSPLACPSCPKCSQPAAFFQLQP
jgi:hypothetical protein